MEEAQVLRERNLGITVTNPLMLTVNLIMTIKAKESKASSPNYISVRSGPCITWAKSRSSLNTHL